MQKIPTVFLRDPANPKRITEEVDPECQWVLDGEGLPTPKWDGSACMIRKNILYRRHRVKPGKDKPPGWRHWNEENPSDSGHGWAPVGQTTADQYHREVLPIDECPDGTYELVGPMVQGNPHQLSEHQLWEHGKDAIIELGEGPLTFEVIRKVVEECEGCEGIVWHHPDGRMAKLKRRDFGFSWPLPR